MAIWLVGAGPMAKAYADVLKHMGRPFRVVARGEANAQALGDGYGMEWTAGGVRGALDRWGAPPAEAIVSVPVDGLAPVTRELIDAGAGSILTEKPGGLDLAEVRALAERATDAGVPCYVGYNRRFMPSILEAKRRIDAAGGALSLQFDFTENTPRIEELDTNAAIKAKWALANSSHIIDLAFFLCGGPAEMHTAREGGLSWHPSAAAFFGQGRTDVGTAFVYGADWRGPGRWGVEVVLPDERLTLRPVEQLQRMPLGRFALEPVEAAAEPTGLKPGLLGQTEAFLRGGGDGLPTIQEHAVGTAAIVSKIAGYDISD